MSPSWRDGLSIAVAPDEVRVRRHHRGWRRRSDAPVRVTVAAGDSLVAACMTAVDEALPVAQRRRFDARVVLSNHLVRYAVVKGAALLSDPGEREAAARHAMAATYGDMAASWRVDIRGLADYGRGWMSGRRRRHHAADSKHALIIRLGYDIETDS